MPTTIPHSIRQAWGDEVANDVAGWLDENFQQRTVTRGEYREVLSRLDVIGERFDHVDDRFDQVDERFDRMDERFNRVDERFDTMNARMDERFDAMNERFDAMNARFDAMNARFDAMNARFDAVNGRILTMTRWVIGVLALFGTMVTVLLAVAQFTA